MTDGPSPARKLSDADLERLRDLAQRAGRFTLRVVEGPNGTLTFAGVSVEAGVFICLLCDVFPALLAAAERERVLDGDRDVLFDALKVAGAYIRGRSRIHERDTLVIIEQALARAAFDRTGKDAEA